MNFQKLKIEVKSDPMGAIAFFLFYGCLMAAIIELIIRVTAWSLLGWIPSTLLVWIAEIPDLVKSKRKDKEIEEEWKRKDKEIEEEWKRKNI